MSVFDWVECGLASKGVELPGWTGSFNVTIGDALNGTFGAQHNLHAYVLGKAQEVTRILTSHGIPVLQHPLTYAVSCVYNACGIDLGDCSPYTGEALPGHAVIV